MDQRTNALARRENALVVTLQDNPPIQLKN
jgi:hypothetical protein